MCNDTEEWKKLEEESTRCFKIEKEIWRILTPALKNIKDYPLMSCFWPNYMVFEIKKYRGVMFDGTEDWCKIWRKADYCFQKWHEEFGKFSPEHSEVSKLQFTEELCVMAMKNDAQLEKELTCQFKIDMNNLTDFDTSTQKSQKFAL